MADRLRIRLLGSWTGFVCRRWAWVLFLALVAAVVSVTMAVTGLEFQSDRNALLSRDLDWNRNFEDWRSSFPGNEDLYVVVDAGPVGASGARHLANAQALVDELGPALQADPHVELAVWGFDSRGVSPRAMRLLPMPEFESRIAQISQSKPVLDNTSPQRMLLEVIGAMRRQSADVDEDQAVASIEDLNRLIAGIGRCLEVVAEQRPDLAAMVTDNDATAQSQRAYLASESGRLLFIRVTPRKESGTINALHAAITAIRQQIDRVLARYPEIEAGLTGVDVIEADETDAATRDSTVASLVAGVLITWMLIVAFGSWRIPLTAMVALLVGITWSFGFLTLVVGHLQVLSVVFVVILLGLGVAFGIHVAARVELVRHRFSDDPDGFVAAMKDTYQTVGPGVITGAVTTAAAFCTTTLTDFRGVAEMGLIASAGIMLCLLAMFSVFPALLCLSAHRQRYYVPLQTRRIRLFDPRWVMPAIRWPKVTLTSAGLLVAVSLLAVSQMKFDYDLMKLQPHGVDSVQWQERITTDGGQSIWAAVSVVDSLEAARQRKTELQKLACVGDVYGIGLLFPADEKRKLTRIDQVWQHLEGPVTTILQKDDPGTSRSAADKQIAPAAPGQGEDEPNLIAVLSTMRIAVGVALVGDLPVPVRDRLQVLSETINHVMAVHARLGPQERSVRLSRLQSEYSQWRRAVAGQVAAALDRSPLSPADVPAELLWPYIGRTGPHKGKFALEIYPKLPEDQRVQGPLDPHFLPVFIGQLEKLDPMVTGVIVQIYRSGYLILHSYRMAGLYALVAVLLIVWIDFRSLGAGLLSMVPVAVGFTVTFGVMWMLDVSVNPANIIVLPLMFGIGVDSGVHMIHRYRQELQSRPLGLTGGTGKAITITSLTTMIGFGAMMCARHRGIASLGLVMTTGIGLTMLACWTVVPAWLELQAKRREVHQTES